MTNQSTNTARSIIEWLLDAGVEHVVVAPGSRSAPLSYAFAQAAASNNVTMHVRIDERDAGFLALGLAKASGRPVPVVVTSGSAVANLLPAVVEAHYSGVPLIVLAADRPASSRAHRAPQTIDQANIFGEFASGGHVDVALDDDVDAVLASVFNSRHVHRGPIHINAQFDVPLMPDDATWSPTLGTHKVIVAKDLEAKVELNVPAHGLVIVGDLNDPEAAREIAELAERLGWPIIWETSSNTHGATNALSHGVLLLDSMPTPDMVLSIGAVGLSRVTAKLLHATPQHISVHLDTDGPEVPDSFATAHQIVRGVPLATNTVDEQWLASWRAADRMTSDIVVSQLRSQTLTGPSAAVQVWNHVSNSANVMVAASWPVRHIEAYAPSREGVRTFGNRGANGIDGLIATAWGVACGSTSPTYLLIGDIAFLHDIGGLNVAEGQPRPDLTIVVLDNDGSGIFSQLEQGAPAYARHYEEVFGTPHGRDLWVIAEALGVPAKRVTTRDELGLALELFDRIGGVNVIVCTTGNRKDENTLISTIREKVSESLQESEAIRT